MPCKFIESEVALSRMKECVANVKEWMVKNFLKLNDSETEFLVLSKWSWCDDIAHIKSINIGESTVNTIKTAKNIECFIDPILTMETQVNNSTYVTDKEEKPRLDLPLYLYLYLYLYH